MIVLAASNNSRSTTATKASGDLIHISGSFWTRFFFSLKERRFHTLSPTYFSLIKIWWTVPLVQGRPRSVGRPRWLRSAAISRSLYP